MDQPQPSLPKIGHALRGREVSAQSSRRDRWIASRLTLVSDDLLLAFEDDRVPAPWKAAIARLTSALDIDARWMRVDRPSGLLEKARRAVGASGEARQTLFAPWCLSSPASLQHSQAVQGAEWVASYLFDFGSPRAIRPGTIDLMLMSPCLDICASDDALMGPMPRMGALIGMIRAAEAEGRKRLAIIVREAARATIATGLLATDSSLNRGSLAIEFLSIEEAVVQIQRGDRAWDGVIAMPDLRGIVFAMLSETYDVTGPWPMLWFDRGLCKMTGETLSGANPSGELEVTHLMQSLALLARYSGRLHTAERLYKGWVGLRDSGVVSRQRRPPSPYVNEISDAAFIKLVNDHRSRNTRALPRWKGCAWVECEDRTPPTPVRLSLAFSQ